MKGLIKAIVGLTVVGGGLLYFGLHALQSSGYQDRTAPERLATLHATQALSVTGRIKQGSIRLDAEAGQCTFVLLGGEAEIPVEFRGEAPADFSDSQEVVVQGWLDTDGVFQARALMSQPNSER